MNDVDKKKERLAQELLKIQKYFYSPEWEAIREDIEYRLEVCEDYIGVDNHLVPELTESYNSLTQFIVNLLEEFHDKISSSLVQEAIAVVIKHNKEKFYHFPALWESRDVKRYSVKDLYRGERQTYQNILSMEEAYLKNIWQWKEENDNSKESWQNPLAEWISLSS